MKQFFAKHPDGNITICNYPIKETGAESYSFEVDKTDMEAVEKGEKDWKIENGKLLLVTSTRKEDMKAEKLLLETQEQERKDRKLALIKAVTEGKATKEEQEEFANLL